MQKGMWRFLDSGKGSAVFHMALDDAILQAVERGESPPTFRLFEWEPPAITIGHSQKLEEVLEYERCVRDGVEVTRRLTGGRAVYHERELAYSVIGALPDARFGTTVTDAYREICRIILDAFASLGFAASWSRGMRVAVRMEEGIGPAPCFLSASRYEITMEGKKVAGSAQRRIGSVFLQQGSILTGPGHERIVRYLRGVYAGQIGVRMIREKSVDMETAMGNPVNIPRLKEAIFDSFATGFGGMVERGAPAGEEMEHSHRLMRERYGSKGWVLGHGS